VGGRHPSRAGSLLPLVLSLLSACGGGSGSSSPPAPPPPTVVERSFDFAQGNGGWLSGQADYTPQTAPTGVVFEVRPLPAGFSGSGFYVAGRNLSDDLFLYVKTKISGLAASTTYGVSVRVEFLSAAASGCVGVGGAPGESVWVVFAASAVEPLTVFNGTDYRVNLQRGNQSVGGPEGIVLGDIANGSTDCGNPPWRPKSLSSPEPATITVRADERGEAWVLVGIDSGYESFSSVYHQRMAFRFTPR